MMNTFKLAFKFAAPSLIALTLTTIALSVFTVDVAGPEDTTIWFILGGFVILAVVFYGYAFKLAYNDKKHRS